MGLYGQLQYIKRYREIINVMGRYGFKEIMGQLNKGKVVSKNSSANKDYLQKNGLKLRLAFEELGPTFIKIGQILSTRADIFPESYIEELSRLQDNVTPIGAIEAAALIEDELNIKINEIFSFFDEKPMAVASIGQVHRATLFTGEELVVKIKKPNIEKQLILDLDIVQRLATFLEKKTSWGNIYKISELASELRKNILEELDYKNEARNADRFNKNFEDDPGIYIPSVYWKYTNRNVLSLEFKKGYHLNRLLEKDESLVDRHKLAGTIVDSYFNQIFVHGFFHGDPHPGNIIILPGGEVMFVDFGTAGYLNDDLKSKFRYILKSIVCNRTEDVAEGIIDLGIAPYSVNRADLTEDINRLQNNYYNTPLENIDINEVLQDFIQISYKHNIHLPREFLLLVKTLGTLEGIVSRLDPEYKLINSLTKFGKDMKDDILIKSAGQMRGIFFDYEKMFSKIPAQINKISGRLAEGEMQLKVELVNTDSTLKKLGKIINRLSFSVVLASIIIGLSLFADKNEVLLIYNIPLSEAMFVGGGIVGLCWLIVMLRSEK